RSFAWRGGKIGEETMFTGSRAWRKRRSYRQTTRGVDTDTARQPQGSPNLSSKIRAVVRQPQYAPRQSPPQSKSAVSRPPGFGVVRVHEAPAQHRPRPGLKVLQFGIPAEWVRVEPSVYRPRPERGERRQTDPKPGPEDRLAPVGDPWAPGSANQGRRLFHLFGAAPSVRIESNVAEACLFLKCASIVLLFCCK
ncbi:unnamed protein product, partial [Pylaiella littoralis]